MIRVVEVDRDVMELEVTTDAGSIVVITGFSRQDDELKLINLHIDGPGSGSIGMRVLRDFARELGRQFDVKRVSIQGGVRTTGANPGHAPRPIVILVGEY